MKDHNVKAMKNLAKMIGWMIVVIGLMRVLLLILDSFGTVYLK